jgi:hypothetical protein
MGTPSNTEMPFNLIRRSFVVSLFLFASQLPAQNPAPMPEIVPPPGQVVSEAPTELIIPPDVRPEVPVTDTERSSVEITSLNLDLHLIPADAREEAHATMIVRNTGTAALARIPLQLSSTLHWISASAATDAGLKPIPFTQSPIATDTDHTGYAQEAIFTPAEPLAPGASLTLSAVYRGDVKQNADRLELIGAPHDRAAETDWDAILPTSDDLSTSLRGFGNVLWYPVAAPTAQFGNGNQLFTLIARERRRNADETMRLRLTVEYVGDPPDSVLFNGQLQPLIKAPDVEDQLIDATHGIATAEFPAAPIGFRAPSIFWTAQHANTSTDQLLTTITPQEAATAPYLEAVGSLKPVLSALLGSTPRQPLVLLDHAGEPFEDAGFVAAQLSADADPRLIAPALIRGLTHAWFRDQQSPQTRAVPASSLWIDEGLPEFLSLDWTARTKGTEAAIGELRHAAVLIALAEPFQAAQETGSREANPPQPLTQAYSDAFLRLKSAFVFWQLREMLGDELFNKALTAFRHSLALNPAFDRDPTAFQKSLEKTADRDLGWFFDDWVYHDKGLPDLTLVQANPRPLPVRAGKSGGYIVAVEVRNDGDVVAEVPVTVRAGKLFATERLRIAAHASASTRVVFEGTPESVEVNDGSVPELRSTSHTLDFPPPSEAK